MHRQDTPIFLIGPMGAGKSTIGRRLARRLEREFIDCDDELEARTGVDIPRIFDVEGESGFREREAKLLTELSQRPGTVLATGGGAVVSESNRRLLGSRGQVVYLRVSLDTQFARVRDSDRPLLRTDDPKGRLRSLMDERAALYEATADLTVDTDDDAMDAVVDEILRKLEEIAP
ncbi:shikimate kinase AroK [Arhodomonas sp. AD133]|uniref:shikimate kinase AroK n=1 Tax=Arhodomonas sp. AD133 TaxID=3415009 RepID=UPI003EB73D05